MKIQAYIRPPTQLDASAKGTNGNKDTKDAAA